MPADPKPVACIGDDTDDGPNIDSGVTVYHGAREADARRNSAPGRGDTTAGTQASPSRKGVAGTEDPGMPIQRDVY